DQGTRLLELVQQAAKDAGAQSGIVVFTDGIANGDKKTLETAVKLPVPVFTVGVGDTEGFTDVRITDVRTPEFAFRGREFKLDLTVQASGMKGKTVPRASQASQCPPYRECGRSPCLRLRLGAREFRLF
ncbi:MAG: vWA domain-containing protein, partial [Candidatus Binatia bacterium]